MANINQNTKRQNKKILGVLAVLILLGGAFIFGLYIGRSNFVSQKYLNNNQELTARNSDKSSRVDFELFWDVWDIIDKDFIKDKDYQKMLYGSINGMLQSLDDPYTVFMDPELSEQFQDEIEGTFDGIGAEIGIKNDQLAIIAPLQSSPAEKAGLKARDSILKIDDEDTSGMSLIEAVSKIRGEKGTKVRLTIYRDKFDEPKEIEITRDEIEIDSVKYKIIDRDDKNYVHLEILYFGDDTAKDFKDMVTEILAKSVDGIILDVRNNTGGYLQSSIEVASEFLPAGDIVVYESFSDGDKNEFKAKNGSRLQNIPIVVLVNEGTASASEILAGALRDNRNVKLIGMKTFGKGSVQELKKLDNGSSLRVSIAEWLTPSQKNINGEGLAPDLEIDLSDEDYNQDQDPQLDKALEEIQNINEDN